MTRPEMDAQWDSLSKIAVKREPVRLTGIQKERQEQEEIRKFWQELEYKEGK
jgi:hypothetical protein